MTELRFPKRLSEASGFRKSSIPFVSSSCLPCYLHPIDLFHERINVQLYLVCERSTTFNKETLHIIKQIDLRQSWRSIDFPRWKVLPYAFISKQSCSAREKKQCHVANLSAPNGHVSKPNFFSHNYHNYSMFRDVPCSRFYRRPRLHTNWHL